MIFILYQLLGKFGNSKSVVSIQLGFSQTSCKLGTLARFFRQLPGAVFPISWAFFEFLEGRRGLLKIPLHCRWQFRLPGDFFKISV